MSDTSIDSPRHNSLFLILLMMLITLVLWFGFQTYQLVKERGNLQVLQANQETMLTNAQKMRAQLDSIAAGTARLAAQGNVNAAQVVNALKDKGITINPSAAAASK
jgi:regulatory protein YycI of two-component signal transduction system YycFG